MRLARFLAHGGVASRRASERIIAAGRVTVDGTTVTDPATDVDAGREVRVDGDLVVPETHEAWVVHKPLNVVSTAAEPGERRAVVDLVRSEARLYPVGRLDADSTGLILLTNEGELANRLTHPRYEVPKTYRVDLQRVPHPAQLERLRDGVRLDDGQTAPAVVERTGRKRIEITIHEGRNRQVRRMVATVGNGVRKLTRIRFGSLGLGELPEGGSRRLTEPERQRLWEDAGGMDERPQDGTR